MSKKNIYLSFFFFSLLFVIGCCKNQPNFITNTTSYIFNIAHGTLPNSLPIPSTNPTTNQGVALGRQLFYDPILSLDNKQSCSSCHLQSNAFSDTNQFSKGVDGSLGNRNAMPLFNLMWASSFFWDGRDSTLEEQALHPIENPIEMKSKLSDVLVKLNNDATYPSLFYKAFGSSIITKENLAKAIAQFERTLISNNSKFDRVITYHTDTFTASEQRGFALFQDNNPSSGGDCIHCHVSGSTFTDFAFKNNGLDEVPLDSGRLLVTKKLSDFGKFKTPSLRNIALTAPYMHDGRFKTLQEVLTHYDINFHSSSPYIDPVMTIQVHARLNLNQVNDIIAFLHTLTDSTFIKNPAFSKP